MIKKSAKILKKKKRKPRAWMDRTVFHQYLVCARPSAILGKVTINSLGSLSLSVVVVVLILICG